MFIKECKICKKSFEDKANYRKYCSLECCIKVDEERNQRYRDEKRLGLIAKYGSCIFCGDDNFQIHHKDMDKSNNNKNNLVPLCVKCHAKVHYKIIRPILNKHGIKWH